MPAHITHEQFAGEVFGRVLDESSLKAIHKHRAFWVFGAQGPDFFLHNQRTKPTGVVLGRLLHNEAYGTFVYHLVRFALERSAGIDSPLSAFILGFITHAALDRTTHPFINYFSGWVERGTPESIRYTNCHAFFERIIDVLILRLRGGEEIAGFDFFTRIHLGEEMPEILVDAVHEAVEKTFPEFAGTVKLRQRIRNAYTDTMNFYRFTNPRETAHPLLAWKRDEGGVDPTRRFLALFHPEEELPDLDYLNAEHRPWTHPGDPEEDHTDSFLELFERALIEAEQPVASALGVLAGEVPVDSIDLETIVGNENLSDGRAKKTKRRLDLIEPLPLDEVLASVYAKVGSRMETDNTTI